jgi:hypothetical protein
MAENNTHTHLQFSHSVYSIAELINVFQLCSTRIQALYEHSSENFKILSIATRNHYKQVYAIHQLLGEVAITLNQVEMLPMKEAKEGLTHISNIITVLQFDDIVRQKLEHIQQTINEIIAELWLIQQSSYVNYKQEIKYVYILSEITKLHAAQLEQSNQDYQNAFSGIEANLKGVQVNSDYINQKISLLAQQEVTEFKAKLVNVSALSKQLIQQIAHSLTEITSCNAFSSEVETINTHLQKIFTGKVSGIKTETNKEVLAQLQNLYTMESERAIHRKVLEAEASLNETQVTEDTTDTLDDNLELF